MRNSYDPSLKYSFTRPVRWNGEDKKAGDEVPVSDSTPAVLNALVRMRHIEPMTDAASAPVTETPTATAEIKRDAPKTYNVYVMGMPMNSEPFTTKSAAVEWCESQGLTYNYS